MAWCRFGAPEVLPKIDHRKEWEAGVERTPDYRITCFFVDRRYRRVGVAGVALRGAPELIAQAGGSLVRRIRKTFRVRMCRPRSCISAPEASSSWSGSITTGPRARTIA